MDRLLLLMPRFMDYEKSLKEYLNRKYEICWLDSDEFDQEILDKFSKCNKIRWGVRHLFRKCFNHDLEKAEGFFLENELNKILLVTRTEPRMKRLIIAAASNVLLLPPQC